MLDKKGKNKIKAVIAQQYNTGVKIDKIIQNPNVKINKKQERFKKVILPLPETIISFEFSIEKKKAGDMETITAIKKMIKFKKKSPQEKSKSNLEFKLKLKEAKSFWIFQIITGYCIEKRINNPIIK